MLDGDGRELIEGKCYCVRQFGNDDEAGPWNIGRWEGGCSWTVLGDRIGFGVVTVGSRVPLPDEEPEAELPEDICVDDLDDGLVTLWHDCDRGYSELTPPQARTLAAQLVKMASKIEATDTPADEPAPKDWTPGPGKPPSEMMWFVPVSPDDVFAPSLILPAFIRDVSCRVIVPAGTSGCGTVRFDPDGEPREFVVDGRSYPFVPDTPRPVSEPETLAGTPEPDQPACLDDHPQYGKRR